MEILVVHKPVDEETLHALANAWHKTLVKGVADISLGVVALGGKWHKDAKAKLLAEGSQEQNIWGFSIYPDKKGDSAIEYESHVNIRPKQGNFGTNIESTETRKAVQKTVAIAIPFLDL